VEGGGEESFVSQGDVAVDGGIEGDPDRHLEEHRQAAQDHIAGDAVFAVEFHGAAAHFFFVVAVFLFEFLHLWSELAHFHHVHLAAFGDGVQDESDDEDEDDDGDAVVTRDGVDAFHDFEDEGA